MKTNFGTIVSFHGGDPPTSQFMPRDSHVAAPQYMDGHGNVYDFGEPRAVRLPDYRSPGGSDTPSSIGAADYNNTKPSPSNFFQVSQPIASSTTKSVLEKPKETRSADAMFLDMIGRMLSDIPEGEAKDMLRLDIQQKILKTKYGPKEKHLD